jgi:hypothetical protein
MQGNLKEGDYLDDEQPVLFADDIVNLHSALHLQSNATRLKSSLVLSGVNTGTIVAGVGSWEYEMITQLAPPNTSDAKQSLSWKGALLGASAVH